MLPHANLPHHDRPGVNPNPHLQPLRRRQPANSINQSKAGTHRMLRVVFVGLGIAEIREHAVA